MKFGCSSTKTDSGNLSEFAAVSGSLGSVDHMGCVTYYLDRFKITKNSEVSVW